MIQGLALVGSGLCSTANYVYVDQVARAMRSCVLGFLCRSTRQILQPELPGDVRPKQSAPASEKGCECIQLSQHCTGVGPVLELLLNGLPEQPAESLAWCRVPERWLSCRNTTHVARAASIWNLERQLAHGRGDQVDG